jgi:hypothetical protein
MGEPEVPSSGKTAKEKPHDYQSALPETKEAEETKEGFHKGGKAKRKPKKRGGHAEGHREHHRLDRHPRAAGGRSSRSPFTEARATKPPESGGAGQGKEGDGPKGMDREPD